MDKLPFYEIEELLDSLKMLNEKEEEERKKQEGNSAGSNMNLNSMSRQLSKQSSIPTPTLPNFKL